MKVAVLGSGSRGNATLVWCGNTRLLVDAGFSARDLARRLVSVDVEPDSIDGIIVTHDHGDHTKGIGVFARRHGSPIYMTASTHSVCSQLLHRSRSAYNRTPTEAVSMRLPDLGSEP